MYGNPYDIYLWFELKKGDLPIEVETQIKYHRDNLNKNLQDPTVFETNESFFLKTPLQLISGDYYFYLYTAGWQNLSHRVFLELNPSREIGIKYTDANRLNQTVKDFNLGLLTVGDICLVQNRRYYVKKEVSAAICTLFTIYILSKTQ